MTAKQRRRLGSFVAKARGCDDDASTDSEDSGDDSGASAAGNQDREQRLAELKDPAIAFAKTIIQQHLGGSPFDSPLIAYAAMLSVNRFGSWEEPGSYNSHLSALVYCGQLWVFRFACERADHKRNIQASMVDRGNDNEDDDDDDDGLDDELDSQMRNYFTNIVSKPLAYILLWRRRLFSIAPITMVNRPAAWDLAQRTVTYRGCSISIEQVRTLCRQTIDRAHRTLFHDLMFGAEHLPRLTPKDLHENDSERAPGWWFGKHPLNATMLHGHKEALAEHVASTEQLRKMWMEEVRGSGSDSEISTLVWRRESVRLYQELVQKFLKDVAAATHFSSGPPVRAPEFMSPLWKNTERLRHIQLRYGKVVIHLVEHKMMATTGKTVNNIRFLCDELGELLVNYLVFVVPLLESMAWQEKPKSHDPDALLWADADGKPWPDARFSDMLRAACRRAEVTEVGTSVWRQMCSAIINTHFDNATDRSCLLAAARSAEESVNEVDEEGRDGLAASLVSMSNHSLRTHRMSYANDSPFANVWDGMLGKSYRASLVWARFFGLDVEDEPDSLDGSSTTREIVTPAAADSEVTRPCEQQHSNRKRTISNVSRPESAGVAQKLQNLGRSQSRRQWGGAALLVEARRLYQDDKLEWRSSEQEQALRLVANKVPEVLLVLATGSGKSLTFMLGCSLPGARTTIVIVPLVLLRLDLVRRCQKMAIDPVVWGSSGSAAVGLDSTPGLLFVSVEIASTPGFRQCARRLYDTGNLDRIVLDECHLILSSAHYRRSMTRLRALRELPVPFVYMTATLPLRLEVELCRRHCMGRATVVRGCSKRPNIHYSVEHLRPPSGEGFIAYACQLIQTHWNDAAMSESKGARVMVFLRSCDDTESAAEHLDCEFYHRDIRTVEEKKSRLARWISGESGSPFLACTTAAGAGVDYPHVRWVIHIDDPYGLKDYAQESGRAGRDGELAGASVFMKRNPKQAAPPTPLDHPDPADDQALKDYLSGADCRRLCFARDLDKPKYWTSCEARDVPCDVCAETKRLEESEVDGVQTRPPQQSGSVGEAQVRRIDTVAHETQEQNDTDTGEGVIELRRQQLQEQHELDEYLVRLSLVGGTCILCRILSPGTSWHHKMDDCPREHKWEYLRCKKTVLGLKQGARGWIPDFAACYYCGQPQSICTQWEGGVAQIGPTGCGHRDLAMPAMWGLWAADGYEREWLEKRMEVRVQNDVEVLIAAGRATEFGGLKCVLAVRLLAELLNRWETST